MPYKIYVVLRFARSSEYLREFLSFNVYDSVGENGESGKNNQCCHVLHHSSSECVPVFRAGDGKEMIIFHFF